MPASAKTACCAAWKPHRICWNARRSAARCAPGGTTGAAGLAARQQGGGGRRPDSPQHIPARRDASGASSPRRNHRADAPALPVNRPGIRPFYRPCAARLAGPQPGAPSGPHCGPHAARHGWACANSAASTAWPPLPPRRTSPISWRKPCSAPPVSPCSGLTTAPAAPSAACPRQIIPNTGGRRPVRPLPHGSAPLERPGLPRSVRRSAAALAAAAQI